MSRERIALDSLASLVIQWQNMFNKVITHGPDETILINKDRK